MHGLKDLGDTESEKEKKKVRVLVEIENKSIFPLDILGRAGDKSSPDKSPPGQKTKFGEKTL